MLKLRSRARSGQQQEHKLKLIYGYLLSHLEFVSCHTDIVLMRIVESSERKALGSIV